MFLAFALSAVLAVNQVDPPEAEPQPLPDRIEDLSPLFERFGTTVNERTDLPPIAPE